MCWCRTFGPAVSRAWPVRVQNCRSGPADWHISACLLHTIIQEDLTFTKYEPFFKIISEVKAEGIGYLDTGDNSGTTTGGIRVGAWGLKLPLTLL